MVFDLSLGVHQYRGFDVRYHRYQAPGERRNRTILDWI